MARIFEIAYIQVQLNFLFIDINFTVDHIYTLVFYTFFLSVYSSSLSEIYDYTSTNY